MKACYSINRKKGYVTIYNNNARYPLVLWEEFKAQNDLTHQQVADELLKMDQLGPYHDEKRAH